MTTIDIAAINIALTRAHVMPQKSPKAMAASRIAKAMWIHPQPVVLYLYT